MRRGRRERGEVRGGEEKLSAGVSVHVCGESIEG